MPAPTVVGTPVANRYGDLSVTVPVGANHLMAGGAFGHGGVPTVETATYNGDAMTALAQADNGEDFATQVLFGLASPDIGTANFVLGPSGAVARAAMALSGVAASTPHGTAVGAFGTGTAPAVAITVGADGLAVATIRFNGSGNTITAGAGETVHVQYSEDNVCIAMLTKTGTGAVSFAPTLTSSADWQIVAVGVNGTSSTPPAGTLLPYRNSHVSKPPLGRWYGTGNAARIIQASFFPAAAITPVYIGAAGQATVKLGAAPNSTLYLGTRTLF